MRSNKKKTEEVEIERKGWYIRTSQKKKKNLRDEVHKKRQMELPLRIAAPIRSSTMERKKRQLTMAHLEVSSPRYALRSAKHGP